MATEVTLYPETTLTVSCSQGGIAAIKRLSYGSDIRDNSFNSPLSNVDLTYGCSAHLGPFNQLRTYSIDTVGIVSHSVQRERVSQNVGATGLFSGGALSVNQADSTKFNISAGSGIVVDNYTDVNNPTTIKIYWPNLIGLDATYLEDSFTSYIAIDHGGNIIQRSGFVTSLNRRDNIILGLLIHTSNVVVEGVSNFAVPGYDQANTLTDLATSVGVINLNGNLFSSNTTNLSLYKSSGTNFRIGGNIQNSIKSPNVIDVDELTAPVLFKPYRNGVGGYTIDTPTQYIDPLNYDNGSGTLTTVAASDPWQIVRIYLDPVNNNVIAHYGQAVYKNALDAEYAINGEYFSPNPVLVDAVLRCFLVIKRDCTSLQDSAKCKFIAADRFGDNPSQGSTTNIPLLTGSTLNRPESAIIGSMYFDTTLNTPVWFDGSNWRNSLGVIS